MELKVFESLKKDIGRGLIRIDANTRKSLGVSTGGVVEIIGKKTAVAIVWSAHPQDEGLSIIRMDGYMRQNAGVSLGDKIKIKNCELNIAKKIIFAPLQEIRFSPGFYNYLKGKVIGRPIIKGNSMMISVFSTIFAILAEQTVPSGPVLITESTEIILNDKPSEEEKKGSTIAYEEIGGLKEEIKKIREMVELPLRYPEIFQRLGIEPPKGVLLYGSPGTGKTMLARAVANESDANFIYVAGPEMVSKFVGESEEKLRKLFDDAQKNAPSIIFLDEIDSFAPNRDNASGEVERRMVSQLLTLMDGMKSRGQVIVVAATNRPNSIDSALRRPGRFDREIEIGIPDANSRKEILIIHTRNMPIDLDFSKNSIINILEKLKKTNIKTHNLYLEKLKKVKNDRLKEKINEIEKTNTKLTKMIEKINNKQILNQESFEIICDEVDLEFLEIKQLLIDDFFSSISSITHGYTGADLSILCKEAAMKSIRRVLPRIDQIHSISNELLENIKVKKEDFNKAMLEVRPSALREVFLERPNISWDNIGGMEEIKEEIKEIVTISLNRPKIYDKMNINPVKGVLLVGPPGCGKTLISKAIASNSNANFISIKGPEVLSKGVGDSEKAIRELFRKAKLASPCIILIDEIDSITQKRGSEKSTLAHEGVVNSILTEMDGVSALKGVLIIATTNRPDIIDGALLRSGRFDRIIQIPMPDEKTIKKIFKVHIKKTPIDPKVNLDILSKKLIGYSGADIQNICSEACIFAIKDNKTKLKQKHFEDAIIKIKRSIKKEDVKRIEKFKKEFDPMYA